MANEDQAEKQSMLSGLIKAAGDLSSRNQNKFMGVEGWLTSQLGLGAGEVRATWVSKAKMVSPRLSTPGIVKHQPPLVLAAIDGSDFQRILDGIAAKMEHEGHLRTILAARQPTAGGGDWTFPAILTRPGDPLASKVGTLLGIATVQSVTPPGNAGSSGGTGTGRRHSPGETVVVDPRIRRMLRHSLATARAVVLIGPPGTGKTTLVGQALAELAGDPGAYGLSRAPAWTEPVTPDESWTANEIVGGPTVHAGEIVFRPGYVLRAIRDDEDLILDEANRGDLDKILGGLLTWLSGQETTVGRVTEAPDARTITVGWNHEPRSRVVNEGLLDDPTSLPEDDESPIRFLAGSEWRLVATYNAVDAQRVFRFGEALGRRFAKIPIPPPDVVTAAELVTVVCTGLDLEGDIAERVVGLYEAHLGADETILGLAPFMEIPRYVASVVNAGHADAAQPREVDDVVAEAYLAQVGLSLARLEEDELDRLSDRLTSDGALTRHAFDWVRATLPALRG